MIRYILVAFSFLIALPWHHHATRLSDHLPWPSDHSVTVNGLTGAEEMDAFRLPSDVFPVSYELKVATDFGNLTYFGRVDIVVQATVKTCRIILNAKDIRVTGVDVIDQKLNTNLPIVDYYLVDKDERLVIALNDTNACLISSRTYKVKVVFEASLRRDMTGFYKSSYKENDVNKWLAVTKFEPTFARKAFPCFDEPALRAPFKISIRRRSDQMCLSNMPLMNSTKIYQTNMVWDHFQETPPIPTYLVAFFVGEFYAMKTRALAIYTHKNYINQAEYMADKSLNLLQAMENFTGVDYVLPKLDLLAIPDCVGAMENWGLNTYSERLLLLTDNSKTKTKEIVTTIVQHELSHLWFGDLVTIAWWDYLWMKEGFATYFQFFATKTVEPDWRLEDVFVYQVHQAALESDQIPMHAMSGSVQSPVQIKGMFDDISYDKAGSVLRMFHYTVTEENFKMALNYYLIHNQYKAATPEQLWIAFENVLYNVDFELDENVSVTEFMKSWTEQAGYPLVTVIKVNDTFIISQERFLVHPSNETDLTEWIIGLTYTTENEKDFDDVSPKTWLKGTEMVLTNQTESGWFIYNIQSIGFFRVNYEAENWNALINQLNNDCSVLHVLNRAQLIDDTFNLARADKVDYTIVLRLSQYLKKEDDVVPWYSAMNGFEYLMNRMRRCPNGYKYFESYVSHLAGFVFMKTDNLVAIHNNTNHSIKTSWNAFSNWACKLDNGVCTSLALTYFELWYQGKKIPADIKDAAFCIGVKNSNSDVWYSILQVYVNSESASDRQSAQWALACSEDRILLSKYLDFMFDGYDGPIRPQDFRVIYQTLASSPKGISVLIEFLTNKLDRVVNEIINGEQVAFSIYSLLASKVALDEEILQMDELRKSSSVPAYLQTKFNSSYSTVENNLAWFHRYHHIVGEWSKTIVEELGLDVVQSINSSTISWDTTSGTTSTESPSLSSASVINGQTFAFDSLIIISLTLVSCQFIM